MSRLFRFSRIIEWIGHPLTSYGRQTAPKVIGVSLVCLLRLI